MSRKVQRFEDLTVWREAMELAERVYALAESTALARDFPLRDQMRRAAVSVPSNIAEGFERGTRSEFHRFLSIAKGSCAELRTQLMLAQRVGHISPEEAEAALLSGEKLARRIGKLRAVVGKQRGSPPMPHPASLMPEEPFFPKT